MKRMFPIAILFLGFLCFWAVAVYVSTSSPQWSPFNLALAMKAMHSKDPLCIFFANDAVVGIHETGPPAISDELYKRLLRKRVKFMELRLRDVADVTDPFLDRYLRRTIPSVSVAKSDDTVYCLSGKISERDTERFLIFVFESE